MFGVFPLLTPLKKTLCFPISLTIGTNFPPISPNFPQCFPANCALLSHQFPPTFLSISIRLPPNLLGVSGRMGEPERTEEHTRGTRARGTRRQARCQCRRTEPEALKSGCLGLCRILSIHSTIGSTGPMTTEGGCKIRFSHYRSDTMAETITFVVVFRGVSNHSRVS